MRHHGQLMRLALRRLPAGCSHVLLLPARHAQHHYLTMTRRIFANGETTERDSNVPNILTPGCSLMEGF